MDGFGGLGHGVDHVPGAGGNVHPLLKGDLLIFKLQNSQCFG